jgi:DNA recombination protein RmuC
MNFDIYLTQPSVTTFIAGTLVSAMLFIIFIVFLKFRQKEQNYRNERDSALLEQSLEYLQSKNMELVGAVKNGEERSSALERENGILRETIARLQTEIDNEKRSYAEKLKILEASKASLIESFRSLSLEALQANSKSFLQLAKEGYEKESEKAQSALKLREAHIDSIIKPVHQTLERFDKKISEIEKSRIEAYSSLNAQITTLKESNRELLSETGNLVKALRSPNTRGRWGEVQLKKVVEMAGMLNHCDFIEQGSTDGDEGRLRPDMIVKLPNKKNIIIDSKTPLLAYLDWVESDDPSIKEQKLKEHAMQVRKHITQLASKSYWRQFENTPEFVVMFIPGENFYSAALEADPTLLEYGVNEQVILATPTTLISMLKAVAYGWSGEQITQNALKISELGQELHERLRVFVEHFLDIKKGLERAVDSYNSASSSLERRVLVSARKFKELDGKKSKEIGEIEPIDKGLTMSQITKKKE